MAKPIQHGKKWRIRWIDSSNHRRSEVYCSYEDAKFALDRHLLQKEEIRSGLRSIEAPSKTFSDLCNYWIEYRLPKKRRRYRRPRK